MSLKNTHGQFLDAFGNVDHKLEVDMFMHNIDARLARANEKRISYIQENQTRVNNSNAHVYSATGLAHPTEKKEQLKQAEELDILNKVIMKHHNKYKKFQKDDKKNKEVREYNLMKK